jgi:hypothetical protein
VCVCVCECMNEELDRFKCTGKSELHINAVLTRAPCNKKQFTAQINQNYRKRRARNTQLLQ